MTKIRYIYRTNRKVKRSKHAPEPNYYHDLITDIYPNPDRRYINYHRRISIWSNLMYHLRKKKHP